MNDDSRAVAENFGYTVNEYSAPEPRPAALKVAPPIPGACVSNVLVALILDLDGFGLQCVFQTALNFCQPLLVIHFGSTRRKGLTSTDS